MPKFTTGKGKAIHGNIKLEPLTDPRQAAFYKSFFDPLSVSFSNAYQSAINAGYANEYAKTITSQMPNWLSERIKAQSMIQKAERNIDSILEYKDVSDVKIRTKANVSMFTLERLNRQKWGKDEAPKTQNNLFIALKEDQIKAIARRVLENPSQ